MEVKIKIGKIEIEFEGEEDFLREDLKNLVSNISAHFENNLKRKNKIKKEKAEAQQKHIVVATALPFDNPPAPKKEIIEEKPTEQPRLPKLSISDIAARIDCKSGVDLILAAAARFTFILDRDTFTLQEILEEMKNADGYFTKNYNINIGQYLMLLVRDRKIKKMGDAGYRLRSAEKARLEKVIRG